MTRILIVEDDEILSRGLSFALEKEGYEVVTAANYAAGRSVLGNSQVDLALLDINLPDKSGACLCEEINRDSDISVIFLTARDTEQDIVKGFELGCDDYISKPFSVDVLKQRIKAVLRRTRFDREVFVAGEISIDWGRVSVEKQGELIKLTATEFKLLEMLVKNRGQVLTRQLLLEKLWDENGNFVDENALSVNIRRLRQKLEEDPRHPVYIITVFGIGYTWGDV